VGIKSSVRHRFARVWARQLLLVCTLIGATNAAADPIQKWWGCDVSRTWTNYNLTSWDEVNYCFASSIQAGTVQITGLNAAVNEPSNWGYARQETWNYVRLGTPYTFPVNSYCGGDAKPDGFGNCRCDWPNTPRVVSVGCGTARSACRNVQLEQRRTTTASARHRAPLRIPT